MMRQERSSNVSTDSFALGGALVREDLNTVLAGEGAEASLHGLYMTSGRQHVDNHTGIDHARPHAVSFETTFLLNYLALPRLLPGRNRITVTVADPRELADQKLEVTYSWQDREGEHADQHVVTGSPYTYTLDVAPVLTAPAENPKYIRYLRLEVR